MIRIYKTAQTSFVLTQKELNIPLIDTAQNVDRAFDIIMDEHYSPSKGVTVRFDKELKDVVYDSGIPDVFEKDFINVNRYTKT